MSTKQTLQYMQNTSEELVPLKLHDTQQKCKCKSFCVCNAELQNLQSCFQNNSLAFFFLSQLDIIDVIFHSINLNDFKLDSVSLLVSVFNFYWVILFWCSSGMMGWPIKPPLSPPSTRRTPDLGRRTMIPTRPGVWTDGCRTRDLTMCRIISLLWIPLLYLTALWWWMSFARFLPQFMESVFIFISLYFGRNAKHLKVYF